MIGQRGVTAIIAIAVLLAVACPATARIDFDADTLEGWADEVFEKCLAEKRFSGLVIVVVQDDRFVFSKGYGDADPVARTPVDPESTRLRIGSNTKTMTATCIAQLVDRGLIRSLDDPANDYLKRLSLPDYRGKQITLWHLLTHQAGFEDALLGVGNADPHVTIPTPGDIIRSRMPQLVREPGTISVYSNYSTAILGVIVEDLTGLTTAEYMRINIFEPLGMTQTELSYDVTPPAGVATPAVFFPGGESQVIPFLGIHPMFGPAGGVISTAADIGRYMQAHLDAGRHRSASILSPEMFETMQSIRAGNHPAAGGFGMKFLVSEWNGRKVFGHGGGWEGFESIMTMLPDSQAGFFIGIIGGGSPNIGLREQIFGSDRMTAERDVTEKRRLELWDAHMLFMTRFLGPYRPPEDAHPNNPLERFTGVYWFERRSHTRMEAIISVAEPEATTIVVEADGAGGLRIDDRDGYREVAEGLFWSSSDDYDPDGDPWVSDVYAFTLDGPGKASRVTPAILGIDTAVRSGSLQNPLAMGRVFSCSVLVCLTGLMSLSWPRTEGTAAAARWLPLLTVAMLVGMFWCLAGGFGEDDSLSRYLLAGRLVRFQALVVLANAVSVTAVITIVFAALCWTNSYWGTGPRAVLRRVHYSLVALAGVGMIATFWFTNLLGYHLPPH